MSTEPAARSLAVKPKLAARPTVIYYFTWAAGSGGVYVGKRTPPTRHNVAEWPTSGTGRLPCGYGGSGNVIRAARAKHPEEAFSWRILEVVPEGGNYAEAEARWVAWAKEAHPEVCRNLTNGGDGWDSETARQIKQAAWSCPRFRSRASAQNKLNAQAGWEHQEYRARISEAMSRAVGLAWSNPETRAAYLHAALQKRLAAAVKRRNLGEQPLPLDNLCLEAFDETRNPLPCVVPREPRNEAQRAVLETLRSNPQGLTAPELCALLGRPETGAGGVRNALDKLRSGCHQPILNDGCTFVLLPEGSF